MKRPLLRNYLLILGLVGIAWLGYRLWSPGEDVTDGRHDLHRNGIWLQHGWLGDDSWFDRYRKDRSRFRSREKVAALAGLLRSHGVQYVFPHLCPCSADGAIAPVDPAQTELFLDGFSGISVLPWVGGVLDKQAFPESATWRRNFVSSIVELLEAHPRLAGIHLNIEPMTTGSVEFIDLLDEIRAALPERKILSVAAFPPPSLLHPFPDVHWEEDYYRQVAQRADQFAVMMYDTGLWSTKLYQALIASWTEKVLEWADSAEVILGIPVYDDAGVGYHRPDVENIQQALLGIHSGLARFDELPKSYAGIAIYCEWEMEQEEWQYLRYHFGRKESDK